MTRLGRLIHSRCDDAGEVHVYEDGRFRYLTFGNEVEQSCLDLSNPLRLEHVYTQAMMLGPLLQARTGRIVLLGMGGGSLVRALRTILPHCQLLAVEQRAAVIAVARAFFELPSGPGIEVLCNEAEAFLQGFDGSADLMFSDLYLPAAVDPRQTTERFLDLARQRLSADGVLLVNQWSSDFDSTRKALAALNQVFDGRVINLHAQGGNIVSFAFRGELPDLKRDRFYADAQALGLRLGVPMQRHARNLWRQNAETLGVGRFRRRLGP